MDSKHAKSPCCGAKVRRFGGKRRQCVLCRKTWTIRPKKRGRPRRRWQAQILSKVLLEGYTLRQLAQRYPQQPLANVRYRFRQELRNCVSHPRSLGIPPDGPLILLADGLWFKFKNQRWVLYLVALKPCAGKEAYFVEPLLLPGNESASRWVRAIAAIPPDLKARIQAIVADNLRGMQKMATQNSWVLQLCQFHLLQKFQVHRRGIPRALRGGRVREEIYQLIRTILELPEGEPLQSAIKRLTELLKTPCGTNRIHMAVREFLWCIDYYRACRRHPELGLPATTNTVECMGSIMRQVLHRNRCASSPKSLLLWAKALIQLRPTINCNGMNINRIN